MKKHEGTTLNRNRVWGKYIGFTQVKVFRFLIIKKIPKLFSGSKDLYYSSTRRLKLLI